MLMVRFGIDSHWTPLRDCHTSLYSSDMPGDTLMVTVQMSPSDHCRSGAASTFQLPTHSSAPTMRRLSPNLVVKGTKNETWTALALGVGAVQATLAAHVTARGREHALRGASQILGVCVWRGWRARRPLLVRDGLGCTGAMPRRPDRTSNGCIACLRHRATPARRRHGVHRGNKGHQLKPQHDRAPCFKQTIIQPHSWLCADDGGVHRQRVPRVL